MVLLGSDGFVPFVKKGSLQLSSSTPGHHHHHHHDHGDLGGHGHTHELMENPGFYTDRETPIRRGDWGQRAFTVGIGGPVGSGKTALVLALCRQLRDHVGLGVVTNDIFTREDWEFLVKHGAIEEDRMTAVETGGCPHAAIREDVSMNLEEVRKLTAKHHPDIIFVESGGDNLAANFSRELADYIIYIVDVAGGDKIPRKGGPGITQSDLFVINKTDLAEAVGADLKVMERDAERMRQGGPTIFTQVTKGIGTSDVVREILKAHASHTGRTLRLAPEFYSLAGAGN